MIPQHSITHSIYYQRSLWWEKLLSTLVYEFLSPNLDGMSYISAVFYQILIP